MSTIQQGLFFAAASALMAYAAAAGAQDKLSPADYAAPNVCPQHYTANGEGGCVAPSDAEVEKKFATKEACENAGFQFGPKAGATGAAQMDTCKVAADKRLLFAECKAMDGRKATIEGKGKDAKCVYERAVPTSSPGAYWNDCFYINAKPKGSDLVPKQLYFVSKQTDRDSNDPGLKLVEATDSGRVWGCKPVPGGQEHDVTAAQLSDAAAERRGYTYGFLTMPYKYFPKQKSFVINAPIGGYLGWRTGQFGNGTTYAMALTLSSVVADTLDPAVKDADGKAKVTGTTNVAALSLAGGVIFDISKSVRGKPFKAGFFVGQDVVNPDANIFYKYNRKTWLAIQLGFDFTDN